MNGLIDEPLRLGMVGGGRVGSIGRSHWTGARLDGRWEVVAGVFSRDPDKSREQARAMRVDKDRVYRNFSDMAKAESRRDDGIDAVTICTHNVTHHEIACAFIDRGIHVICDKPLTTSVANAADLVRRSRAQNVLFAVTYTYSGYPMVRMAREMIANGELGEIRSVVVEYASQYHTELTGVHAWMNDPAAAGPLGVIAGTGTHAFHLAEFITGLRVTEISADLSVLVEGHVLDDHATVHLRFGNGARGFLWNTTVAPGNENGLSIRIYGSKGGLAWRQEHPNHMQFTPVNKQTITLSKGGYQASPAANAVSRTPGGCPEGYLEAFANIYGEVADAIMARRNGTDGVSPYSAFPTVVDGSRGVGFMFAALNSSQANAAFVSIADFVGD